MLVEVSILFITLLNRPYLNVNIERFNISSQHVTLLQLLIVYQYNYIIDKHWLINIGTKVDLKNVQHCVRNFYKNFVLNNVYGRKQN